MDKRSLSNFFTGFVYDETRITYSVITDENQVVLGLSNGNAIFVKTDSIEAGDVNIYRVEAVDRENNQMHPAKYDDLIKLMDCDAHLQHDLLDKNFKKVGKALDLYFIDYDEDAEEHAKKKTLHFYEDGTILCSDINERD